MNKKLLIFSVLILALGLSACKKDEEADLTTKYVGAYLMTYNRTNTSGGITMTDTIVISKKTNSSLNIPYPDLVIRNFSISGDKLVQSFQTVQVQGIEGGSVVNLTLTEESSGTLVGKVLSITGTAAESGGKPFTFTAKATRL